MKSKRVNELEFEIYSVKTEIDFRQSMIGILIAEANLLDAQAKQHEEIINNLQSKLYDLQAELKDEK
jgi:hypothetical protein